MQSKATTVAKYLAELPPDRRQAVAAIRKVILKNLPEGVEEGIHYGMISYHIPHSIYPPGYHCDPSLPLGVAGLASQKQYISLYLMTIYGDQTQAAWFAKAWTAAGKKLDMGKCCVRVKRLDDVPLDVVAEAFRRISIPCYIAAHEAVRNRNARSSRPAKKRVAKKLAKKPTRKSPAKGTKK